MKQFRWRKGLSFYMKGMRKYLVCFKMSAGQGFEYRSDFLLNIFATFIPIAVQLFLWKAVYDNSGAEVINGRTYVEMIAYLLFAFFVTFFLTCSVANSVSSDIKDGNLNQYIIKPVNYFSYKLMNFYGEKVFITLAAVVLFGCSILILRGSCAYSISAGNILWFIALLVVSLLLQFFLYLCMGLSSFWITDAWGIFFGGRYIINILSGSFLPLDVFGDRFIAVLKWLPFQYTTYFPISVLQGKAETGQILQGIAIELVWVALLFGLSRLMWTRGQKKYIANGG